METGVWEKRHTFVSPDQIGYTIWADFVELTAGYITAYHGDLYRDAIALQTFEQDCILRIAKQSRDDFTYKVRLVWACRPSGTDLWTHLSESKHWFDAALRSNPWHISYALELSDNGNSVTIRRYIHKMPVKE